MITASPHAPAWAEWKGVPRAAQYTIEHIGDEPANATALSHVSNATFENLGLTRDVETFLKSGIFQRRLTGKDKIVNDWTEIRAGL